MVVVLVVAAVVLIALPVTVAVIAVVRSGRALRRARPDGAPTWFVRQHAARARAVTERTRRTPD